MGRPKKDKVHFTVKIDRELKEKLDNYPNIEKSSLVNDLLWESIEDLEEEQKKRGYKKV